MVFEFLNETLTTDVKRKCKYCKKTFYEPNGRIFSNHVRWCEKNKTNGDKGISKLKNSLILKRIEIKKSCIKCNTVFKVIRIQNKDLTLRIPKKEKQYCSKECVHKGSKRSSESKKRISIGIQKYFDSFLRPKKERILKRKKCCNCEILVTLNNKSGLCAKCFKNKRRENKDPLKLYRTSCSFKFNIFKYPKEFDLELIKKHGLYKAKNRGNNLYGISRDHKISVKYGFENNIDCKILSHPANCKLMLHSENASKNFKNSISLKELLENIDLWNKKYGAMV